ncbi:hypothetical protein FACS189450_10750 [Spirochaetia bacterium]|nr:hypothetical protein FACS189450_10750 [Spirochaetia bacterium]
MLKTLRNEFLFIEDTINAFLVDFLDAKNLGYNNLQNKTTGELLEIFITQFNKIQKLMNWNNRELYDRAYELRITRNKYCHKIQSVEITQLNEITYLTNIIIFIVSLKEALPKNPSYNHFVNYLYDLLNKIINQYNYIEVEEDKLDKVSEQLVQLIPNIDNVIKEKLNPLIYSINQLTLYIKNINNTIKESNLKTPDNNIRNNPEKVFHENMQTSVKKYPISHKVIKKYWLFSEKIFSKKYAILEIGEGTFVAVIEKGEKFEKGPFSTNWVKIITKEKTKGWFFEKYLKSIQ